MSQALLTAASIGMGLSWVLWRKGRISQKSMVGLTLILSWLALLYSAVTTTFVG